MDSGRLTERCTAPPNGLSEKGRVLSSSILISGKFPCLQNASEVSSETPIYRQIADEIKSDIVSGSLAYGEKLPSIRRMAESRGVSVGTIRHVYSMLEWEGTVETLRGRGTFVASPKERESVSGRKDKALLAIDRMLESLSMLGFSTREAQIFFELRLRQREDQTRAVRMAVVAATPEERSIIDRSFEELPAVRLFRMSFADAAASPDRLQAGFDFIVIPHDLYGDLKFAESDEVVFLPVVLRPCDETLQACLSVAAGSRVGLLTASRDFQPVMKKALQPYLESSCSVSVCLLSAGAAELEAFTSRQDALVLAPECADLADPEGMAFVRGLALQGKTMIRSRFECDGGSLHYVRRAVERRCHELRENGRA